jgi:hypothetical protein
VQLTQLDYDALLNHGVSPELARLVTSAEHPIRDASIFVRPIHEQWDYNVPADASDVVGLWDENADATVRWTRGGQTEYVHLYHDEPEHSVVAWSEQGVLAELARRYFEFLDWHDEEADRRKYEAFAQYIGFRHAAALEAYLVVDSPTTDFLGDFRSRFGRLT